MIAIRPRRPRGRLIPFASLVLGIVALTATDTTAVNCVDYTKLTTASKLSDGPRGTVVAIEDDLLVVGDNLGSGASLLTVDMQDPQHPVALGSTWLGPGTTLRTLELVDGYAFGASGQHFTTFDVTDPYAPVVIYDETLSAANRVDGHVGSFLVRTIGDSVSVWDTSDPHALAATWSRFSASPSLVAITGDILLVRSSASGSGPLALISLADPFAPVVLSEIETSGPWRVMTATSDAVYAGREGDMQVVDISDPAAPTVAGVVTGLIDEPRAGRMMVAGTQLIHTYHGIVPEHDGLWYWGGAQVFDVTDPLHPIREGFVTGLSRARCALTIDGGIYWFSNWGTWHATAPLITMPPVRHASIPVEVTTAARYKDRLVVWGPDRGPYRSKLALLDVGNPDAPEVLAEHILEWSPYRLETNGTIVIARRGSVAAVYDLRDSALPFVGEIPYGIGPSALTREFLFIRARFQPSDRTELVVYDLSTSKRGGVLPAEVGRISGFSGPVEEIALRGHLAYVATGSGGVDVLDTRGGPNAKIIGQATPWPPGLSAIGVAVGRDYLCVHTDDYLQDLVVFDLSDPANPVAAGSAQIGWSSVTPGAAVTVHGDALYIPREGQGMGVVSLHGDGGPTLAGAIGTHSLTSGSFVYEHELVVLERRPYQAGALTTYPLSCESFSSNESGPGPGPRDGVTAVPDTGRYSPGAKPRIQLASRSPFRASLDLEITAPRGLWVDVRVVDVAGRLIRELHAGVVPGGRRTVRWNGKDVFGRSAGSGVFYVSLSSPRGNDVLKAVRLR